MARSARIALLAVVVLILLSIGGLNLATRWNQPVEGPCSDPFSAICSVVSTRNAVGPGETQWNAIGRLVRGYPANRNSHCSGTLIGHDEVLTAAHCLYDGKAGAWLPPGNFRFEAGYRKGRLAAASNVLSYRVGWRYFDPPADRQLRLINDWAVLKLAEPLGETVAMLPILPADAQMTALGRRWSNFLVAGYPREASEQLLVDAGCRIDAVEAFHIFHRDCRLVSGDSGGPLLAIRDFRLFVLGVNVAVDHSIGVPLGIAIRADVVAKSKH